MVGAGLIVGDAEGSCVSISAVTEQRRHLIRRPQPQARARRERELRRPLQGDAEGLGGRRRDQQLGLVSRTLAP